MFFCTCVLRYSASRREQFLSKKFLHNSKRISKGRQKYMFSDSINIEQCVTELATVIQLLTNFCALYYV